MDHPQDNGPWALASYNTSGLVVPVFSNNVHEVRSYNRLAHNARGDVLILVWVWGGRGYLCGCVEAGGEVGVCITPPARVCKTVLLREAGPLVLLPSRQCLQSCSHFNSCSADDDMPPKDCEWIQRVVEIFERWPDAGVVGIRRFWTW